MYNVHNQSVQILDLISTLAAIINFLVKFVHSE